MLTDPGYELQIAMADALLADAGVTALVGQAVYDDLSAPQSAYPRISIGDDQVLGDANTVSDPSEIYSTLHIWAQGPDGRLVAKQIAAEVRRVLTVPLTLNGHVMTSAILHDARFMAAGDPTDPSGLVGHGVLVFHFRTIPAP